MLGCFVDISYDHDLYALHATKYLVLCLRVHGPACVRQVGWSSLMYAVSRGCVPIVTLLLNAGASIEGSLPVCALIVLFMC